MQIFTTEQILTATKTTAIDMIKSNLLNSRKWLGRALLALYARQTDDEQDADSTKWHNSVGFSGFDAEILSSLARQYNERGTLSQKQWAICEKRLLKYAGQLRLIAIQNMEQKLQPA